MEKSISDSNLSEIVEMFDFRMNIITTLFFIIFWLIYFLKHTQWKYKLSFDNSTAMYKKTKKMAEFEPGVFCSGGGLYDHYATPPVGHI
jgi:hypothetical protein